MRVIHTSKVTDPNTKTMRKAAAELVIIVSGFSESEAFQINIFIHCQ